MMKALDELLTKFGHTVEDTTDLVGGLLSKLGASTVTYSAPQTASTPHAERVSTANLPPIDMGGFDTRVSASTPQSVSQGDPMAIPKTLAQIGGAVAVRAPLTAALSVEQGLRNRGILQKGKVQEIKGSEFGSLGETLLGDEPIRSLQEIVPEAQRGLASEGFGAFSLPIAFLGTAGAVGLDLLPMGTLRKAGMASLSKALTPKAAAVVVEKDFPKLWTELAKNKNVAEQFYATVAKETDLAKINTHVEDAARMLIPKKSYTPFAERSVAPLLQEARKYKSAEEFVKAQRPVYRSGRNTPNKEWRISNPQGGANGDQFGGVYFSNSKDVAQGFVRKGDIIHEAYPDIKNPLVVDKTGDVYTKLGMANTAPNRANVKKFLNDKGYDSIIIKDSLGNGYPADEIIVFPEQIKTKSQLTDLYNKAQGGVDTTNPRNFASAEEFMKAQGEPIYHGSPKSTFEQIQKEGFKIVDRRDTMNKGSGISFSLNKTHADKFGPRIGGGTIEASLDKSARLIEGDVFDAKTKEIYDGPTLYLREKTRTMAADFFKKEGYDGVDFTKAKTKLVSESVEEEIRIWNLDKIKTKSQLIDRWKNAQEGVDTTNPRNFASAEEFVKAKTTVWRAGSEYHPSRINPDEGVSFSYDKKIADRFAGMAQVRGGTAISQPFHIKPEAKILDMKDIPKKMWNSEYDMVAYAKKNGYDAIKIDQLGSYKESELRVVNPDVIVDRWQLTDLWKKHMEE